MGKSLHFQLGKSTVHISADLDLRLGMRENGGRHPWECLDATFYFGVIAVNLCIFGLRKFSPIVCALLSENSSRDGAICKVWPRLRNIDD